MEDTATTTSKFLRSTLVALLVLHIGAFVFSPMGGLLVVAIIVLGLLGTSKRHAGMLKFYWISTAVGLVLTVVALVVCLALGLVLISDIKNHPEEYKVGQKAQIVKQADAVFHFAYEHLLVTTICGVAALAVLFLTVYLKVRSIRLAQLLCQQIELLPYVDTEGAVARQVEMDQTETPTQQLYVIPQPMFAAHQPVQFNAANYPGTHLIPIYVDNFGNPVVH